ncbi:hypothetical protein LOZ39_002409 [Ophidiomyces ophidiicola]|nr:hypothetical protein LOZ61_003199 [Ophidiomyces ophidiicola]KAI1918305.1 hypothetical protein LOZ64_002879 [Ophidiomyces ophidiicola]KAI1927578.1 hypothetical protein LOZ60_003033 [Ophidiomyces ophidiicola]KAI1959200.1 hypothetical protein LOZ59_003120 [Ophidiomyces ophidiicola]KAI2014825.1 hypothetical protein LOZ49_001052 [Ophidiomyces ophidiicola]
MPVRERMRRIFSRSSSGTSSQHAKAKPTTVVLAGIKAVKVTPRIGKDGKPLIEIYKPHEVPRSKYRGPVDEEHSRALAAYSIPSALSDRPRSLVSDFSPMGTRAPTRRNSIVGHDAVTGRMLEGLARALDETERNGGSNRHDKYSARFQ